MCVYATYRYRCKDSGKTWTGAHGDLITDPRDIFPVCPKYGSCHVEQKVIGAGDPLSGALIDLFKKLFGKK